MENQKIKVYSTPMCPYCVALKSFLEDKDVDFEEVDVSKNLESAKEIRENTGQMGVPVTEINGEFIIGFDREKIIEKLGL